MVQLQEIPMFSALGETYIKELQNAIHIKHYIKDSILFYEGDKSDYLHILMEGSVKLYKTSPKGTQIHMHNFIAPEKYSLPVVSLLVMGPSDYFIFLNSMNI